MYDKDHPSMAGKGDFTLMLNEIEPKHISSLRSYHGLTDWKDPS